ncbi:hypothetical protein [Phyllobacterium zundukense]|jgi:hypothetical protein|uniref:Uncharacterized protein n=1 Tax=Phyllobacterium zundukense TaxID=1867719 RepID=A0ACD4D6J6_9HYPH|nr:hypothetical protein [Phyllobacterium zundukense]UXN61481.1 hypothetical protein N8E88_15565 [Phyllobacterium zundukense]
MSKFRFLIVTTLLAVVSHAGSSSANDAITLTRPQRDGPASMGQIFTPSERSAKKTSVPITPETMLNRVDDRIRGLFNRAADPATHLVTLTSADKAGIGYFIDSFAEIDNNRDGSLTYSEVKGFLDAQSPIERSSGTGSPVTTDIQIIE